MNSSTKNASAQPGIWKRTRRDLVECVVTIIVMDAIAVGLGGFLSRPLGQEMWAVGFGVAGWVRSPHRPRPGIRPLELYEGT